jgi:O-antigen/teichoic acid export membrane protein
MTKRSLKASAVSGVLWSAMDRFAVQGVQLGISILLARLLMPEDFGLIGMLSIFLAISEAFIQSGMGAGLIQKKNRTEKDYSTVFVFNLVASIAFYLLLFIAAPFIARFYEMPQLVSLTRVLAINIVITSLAIVQNSRLKIKLDFKSIAKVNVVSVIVSGGIALYFAFTGWGVWAIVIQSIVRSVVSVVMFWYLSKWNPSLYFSNQSFKDLFGFGSKLLIQGLYGKLMQNIYNIIIGKYYSAGDLGFYAKAKGFAEITAGTVTGILYQVTFPILASIQDDKERLVSVYSRLIRMTVFFIMPSMTLLALLADPFIRFFLTEKWLPAVVLLQWMSFARVFYPIGTINMNILNAIGRSDLFLKVDLAKFPIALITLLVTIPLGVKAMIIGHVVTSCISFFINAYLPGKLLGYGAFSQLRDMLRVILATMVMALCVYGALLITKGDLMRLLVGGITGLCSYFLTTSLLKVNEVKELKVILQKNKK